MRVTSFIVLAALPSALLYAMPSSGAGDAGKTKDAGPSVTRKDAAADGGAKTIKDSGPVSKIPPDPEPLSEKRQWVIDLRWEKGDVFFVAAKPLDLEAARPTPRVMGRFALELFEGKTLLERARFDFPGLVDGDFTDAGHADPPRLDRKMTTRVAVMFPRTSRGTKLELWDRATDRRFPLPWPPPEEKATR